MLSLTFLVDFDSIDFVTFLFFLVIKKDLNDFFKIWILLIGLRLRFSDRFELAICLFSQKFEKWIWSCIRFDPKYLFYFHIWQLLQRELHFNRFYLFLGVIVFRPVSIFIVFPLIFIFLAVFLLVWFLVNLINQGLLEFIFQLMQRLVFTKHI